MFLLVKLPYFLLSNISLIKNKVAYNVYITAFCLPLLLSSFHLLKNMPKNYFMQNSDFSKFIPK
ncbi:hypothetical protein CCYN2B_410008 [Capnocytophaga cynodegmi]|uniref:Uncharacterized protein n=1 Tax=Capnocytophaga cynodegmi TaxID=28189 RepID=A0A0B7HJ83_9FLAO|nr:hypothetical protein CCYN2B_410008 [Capnocytophaga cynodegmi]